MSDFNNITNILKTINCLYYVLDKEKCLIVNTSDIANTYQSTEELISIKDMLVRQNINYTVDEDLNFRME